MHRRTLLKGAAILGLASTINSGFALGKTRSADERVAALLSVLREKRKTPLSAKQIAEHIAERGTALDHRTLAFELVRALPYRLSRFDAATPDALFATGHGDCRHKALALHRLFKALGETSRTVLMPFDWKDLPIPASVLRGLSETRGFHDCVEIEIDGAFRLADATWDKALLSVGFPGRPDWDGLSATPAITERAGPVIQHGSYKSYGELFDRFKIRWPQRDKTLAFNRAFNRWASALREGGDLTARR